MSSIEPRALLNRASITMQKTINEKYAQISKELNKSLNYKNNPGFSIVSIYVLYKMVEQIIQELENALNTDISEEVEEAYILGFILGLSSQYEFLGNPYTYKVLYTEAKTLVNYTKLIDVKNVTMKDLLQMTRNTEYSVKQLIRETMTKHLNIQNMQNMGRTDLADLLIKELQGKQLQDLIDKNVTAIVDRAGRRWSVDNYVDMVTTTKAHQVYVQGLQDFSNKNGGKGDLARIPHSPLTVDACKNYEGMIISMTGATPGYRTYAELKATRNIFHPRCRHNPVPYWDEVAIPKKYIEHNNKLVLESEKFENRQREEQAKKLIK